VTGAGAAAATAAPQCAAHPRDRLCRPPAGNLAAERMALDDEALRNLDAVAPWPDDPSQAV
jgi:hypothetical protein